MKQNENVKNTAPVKDDEYYMRENGFFNIMKWAKLNNRIYTLMAKVVIPEIGLVEGDDEKSKAEKYVAISANKNEAVIIGKVIIDHNEKLSEEEKDFYKTTITAVQRRIAEILSKRDHNNWKMKIRGAYMCGFRVATIFETDNLKAMYELASADLAYETEVYQHALVTDGRFPIEYDLDHRTSMDDGAEVIGM